MQTISATVFGNKQEAKKTNNSMLKISTAAKSNDKTRCTYAGLLYKYNRERNKKSNAIREAQNRFKFNLKFNRLKLTMVKPLPLKEMTNKVKQVSTLIQKMYKNK